MNLDIVNFVVFKVHLCKVSLKDVQHTFSQQNLKLTEFRVCNMVEFKFQ